MSKNAMVRRLAIAAAAAVGFAACGSAPVGTSPTASPAPSVALTVVSATPSAPTPDPAAVALRFFDLANGRDATGLAALFTDDVVFFGGPRCQPCRSSTAASGIVPQLAAGHATFTVRGTPQVAGGLVFLRYESRSDNDPKAGVERQLIVANITVAGDRISAFIGIPDLNDPQTLKGQIFARSQGGLAPSTAAKADPAGALRRYQDAIGRGDAAAAAAVFADKAVNIGESAPCTQTNPCTDPANSLKGAQNEVADHQRITTLGDPVVAVDLALLQADVRQDSLAAAGVERIRTIGGYQAQGDKLIGRIVLFDLSDPQTARFQLYVQHR